MRHFWIAYAVSIVLGCILIGLFLWAFFPTNTTHKISSPLPDFLSMHINDQVSTINLFLPNIQKAQASNLKPPDVEAKAALIYSLTTNEVLYTKNEHEKLPMASLTKIMTAIVALENKREDDRYSVFKTNLIGEESMGLTAGEILSFEELLYGLILASGNDAAEVLAANFPKGRNAFVLAMNNKAKALGLINTNFTNPSGLQGDGKQYTTAYDLLIVTNYALSHFSLFRQVVATFDYNIPYSDIHKAFYLENETNLLTSYPGVKGVKTGYTPEAGLCLVTYLDYKGQKIIGILLNSENRRDEMKQLLDYSLKTLGTPPPPHI